LLGPLWGAIGPLHYYPSFNFPYRERGEKGSVEVATGGFLETRLKCDNHKKMMIVSGKK
jgi:hypothetical protein